MWYFLWWLVVFSTSSLGLFLTTPQGSSGPRLGIFECVSSGEMASGVARSRKRIRMAWQMLIYSLDSLGTLYPALRLGYIQRHIPVANVLRKLAQAMLGSKNFRGQEATFLSWTCSKQSEVKQAALGSPVSVSEAFWKDDLLRYLLFFFLSTPWLRKRTKINSSRGVVSLGCDCSREFRFGREWIFM